MYDMRGEEAKKEAIAKINVIIPELENQETRKPKYKSPSFKCPALQIKGTIKKRISTFG